MLNIIVYNQTIIRCYFEMYGKHAIYPSIINLLTDFFPFKGTGSVRFLCLLEEVSYYHQGCIYKIKNTIKTVILWNI